MSAVAALLAAYVLTEENGPLSWSGLWQSAAPEAPAADGAPAPSSPPAVRGPMALNPLEGLTPQSFAAVIERPLFNPGRVPRPAAPPSPLPELPAPDVTEEQVAVVPPQAEDYKLLGISGGPEGRIAALRLSATNEVLYLREGEKIGDWTVLAIDDRSVSIGDASAQVVISLFAGPAGGDTAGGATAEPAPVLPQDMAPPAAQDDSPTPQPEASPSQ